VDARPISAPTTREAAAASVASVTPTEGGTTVKLTVNRSIPLVLAFGVAALLVSGIPRYKNAKHGFDFVVGEIAWLGFLAGALAVLALAAVALVRLLARRRAREARA
jgi:hypothetical protein